MSSRHKRHILQSIYNRQKVFECNPIQTISKELFISAIIKRPLFFCCYISSVSVCKRIKKHRFNIMKLWGQVWTFAQKCVRLPILVHVIPFVILRVTFDIYNKSMIVQFIFVHTFKQNLNDACKNKGLWTESQMDLFSNRVPDGSLYLFTRKWTNYHDLCINQILNMT